MSSFQLPAARIRPDIVFAWRGGSVLVTDLEGRVDGNGLTGVYFREARFLSRLALTLDGETAFSCSSAQAGPQVLEFTWVHPETQGGGGGGSGSGGAPAPGGLLYRGIDIRARYVVRPNGVDVEITFSNRWNPSAELAVAFDLAADFADLIEVRAGERQQNAEVRASASDSGVRFTYDSAALPYETEVTVPGDDRWRWSDDALRARLRLPRGEDVTIVLRVRAHDCRDAIDEAAAREREEQLRTWAERLTRVTSPGEPWPASLTQRAAHEVGSFALLDGSRESGLHRARAIRSTRRCSAVTR